MEDFYLQLNYLHESNDDGIGKAKNEPRLDTKESPKLLFSFSIESRKQVCEVELSEKEVNCLMLIVETFIEEVKQIESSKNA